MAEGLEPRDADVEEATAQLDQGLKSCRSIVRNYRAMLSTTANTQDDEIEVSAAISGRARPQ